MVLISGITSFVVDPKLCERVSITGEERSNQSDADLNLASEYSYERINSPLQFYRASKSQNKVDHALIFKQARSQLEIMIQNKVFTKSHERVVYIYRCVTKWHSQTGIMCGIDSNEYDQGRLLPNEETIPCKVEDIICATKTIGIYTGFPIGFSEFPEELSKLIQDIMAFSAPILNTFKDGVNHTVYKTSIVQTNDVVSLVGKIPYFFVADGHHRIQAYSELISQIDKSGATNLVEPDFNFIPIVLFPGRDLKILKFNRIIKEIPEMDDQALISKMAQYFLLKEIQPKILAPEDFETAVSPSRKGEYTFYLTSSDKWYNAKMLDRLSDNPMETIDAWYLSHYLFTEILGIKDVRNSKIIEYVPETSGSLLSEQQRCMDKKNRLLIVCMQATIGDIEKVSLLKQHMPPKSTLFYPKPLLGLVFKNLEKFDIPN